MIWIKKTFPRHGAGWGDDQTRFADLQFRVAADGTDAYRRMLMISVRKDDDPKHEDIYLRLGDEYGPLLSWLRGRRKAAVEGD